jgi:hypothetical protein
VAERENWEHEQPDDGRVDFGFGPARIEINISGGNVTFMFGGQGRVEVNQAQGDWYSLNQSLTQYGFKAEDIQALKAALEADGGDQVGDNTRGWLGRAAEMAADGVVNVAIPVVLRLIRGYLGLP